MRFLILFVLLCGCSRSLTPAQQAKSDLFECQARAVAPLVEPVLEASTVVRDIIAGKADLDAIVHGLRATQADVDALVDRLKACSPQPPAGPLGAS